MTPKLRRLVARAIAISVMRLTPGAPGPVMSHAVNAKTTCMNAAGTSTCTMFLPAPLSSSLKLRA